MTTIQYLDHLPKDMEDKMVEGFVAYEASHGIDVNYTKFALIMSNEQGALVGVLNAYICISEVYVQDFWIAAEYRRKGYGRKLMEALEDRFKGKGFNNINLVTNHFNAVDFYKKCGFTEECVRKNIKNPKLSKSFFVKFFDDEVQHQGVLNKIHTVEKIAS
jgi:ribosomal protein S18 acetylase RimI-like enzyme